MLFFFPRGVLDGILNLTESVSEGFPSNFYLRIAILIFYYMQQHCAEEKPNESQSYKISQL